MSFKIAIFFFVAIVLIGCGFRNGELTFTSPAVGLYPGNELGVTVDENLMVIDVDSSGAAYLAGIQPGDTLVDVTLVITDQRPVESDSMIIGGSEIAPLPIGTVEPSVQEPGTVITNESEAIDSSDASTVPSPEPIATSEVPKDAVPFRDRETAKYLIAGASTVSITINRGGNLIELSVQPAIRASRPNAPTPTAVVPPDDYW